MLSSQALGLDSVMLDEVRSYLHIDDDIADPALGAIFLAAINHAEGFIRQAILQRPFTQILSAGSGWQKLAASPVTSIVSATGIPADGAAFAMSQDSWQYDIDPHGDAAVRIRRAGLAGRVEFHFIAGMAADWSALPEALRLAILRLTGYLYNARDAADDAGPPASVAALLQPWRRMQLSASRLSGTKL